MHPWVAILGLIFLPTNGVMSYPRVTGVVGQPVRLPCTYGGEVVSTCWGRGACPLSRCGSEIIWTSGHSVTFRKDKRYKLNGNIGGRDVSLTIENAALSDSGLYCCRIEKQGWFNDIKIILELSIKPAPPTTSTTTTTTTTMTTTTPTTTITPTTMVVTTAPVKTRASTSALPMSTPTKNLQPVASLSSPTQTAETQPTTPRERNMTGSPTHSCSTDGNGTVTQSPDALWHNNQMPEALAQDPWMSTRKGVYIGISVTALVLIAFLVFMFSKRYFCLSNKVELLRMIPLRDAHIGALKKAALKPVRAEDNIYIIDDLH
ncbi:hepatitis A virus cellular receptor 1-like [Hippopotamus amphibius kiboko]|uniref:hepatitis A virus cellular receptor 1-like n=1 Tax=Hippopotamus amphibius kiboko TaxID=575201 RepID=UPI002593E208|nr:hepatitis A virus cellular receptor 1-like [Hippopotamus amphibius kiboko]